MIKSFLKTANYLKLPIIFFALFAVFNFFDYHNLGDIFRQGKYRWMFFALAPITFFWVKEKLHWTIGFYAAYLLLSFVMWDYPIVGVMSILLGFGVIFFSAFMVTLEEDFIAKLLVVSGTFQAMVAILQWQGIHFLFQPAEAWGLNLTTGTYGHNTILGPFLACCLAPALWKKQWVPALFMTFACAISKSTMTIGSLAAIYMIYLWYRTSFNVAFYLALMSALALAVGFMLTPVEHHEGDYFYSMNGRAMFWGAGWKAFLEAPFFGGGPGSWVGKYTEKYIGTYQRTMRVWQLHNDYLEYLVEYGAVPFAILFAGLVVFIKKFKPTWTHAVCAALLVNALGNFPFQIVPLALLFIVCFVYSNRANKKGVLK